MMALFVILGAFGAHALEGRLSAPMLEVYKTGVFYHAIHGLGLLAMACLESRRRSASLCWAGRFLTAGLFLFSGSLYLLAVTGIKKVGMVTPFGGLAFIAGWIFLAKAGFETIKASEWPQSRDGHE